ncbi:MAG TPA: hypothetical protein DC047_20605 [Blastocatellia bacterium]|nr:hypothetical protein [Blastocatellia bacterium]
MKINSQKSKAKFFFAVFGLLSLLFAICSHSAEAQTNTFPASGNVGIGTTSPNAKLVIASGNVGLGSNDIETWSGATSVLESLNTSLFFGQSTDLHLVSNAYNNSGWKYKSTGVAANYYLYNGMHAWRVAPSGTADTALTWIEAMSISNSGNVGIGTTSPVAKLDVRQAGNAGAVATLLTSYGANEDTFIRGGTSAAVVHIGDLASTTSKLLLMENGGNVGIGTASPSSSYKLDVNGAVNASGNISSTGNITASGSISAKYQDVAEWVESSQYLSAGTVVVLDKTKSNQVIASSHAYDTRVAGVISARPGITLGESGESKVLVATTGRVKVRVDAANGPIEVGDLLVTSDIAGVAKKSEPLLLGGVPIHRPGTLIGKALEPVTQGQGREILVLLSLQ